jgi:tetratricopeptide (TPR) repeat protein
MIHSERSTHPKLQSLILLGSFRVEAPPTAASTKLHAKDKCVLGYLAVGTDRPVPRETLRRLLWPDFQEPRGRHSVAQSIYALTRAFPGLFQVKNDTISVAATSLLTDLAVAKALADGGRFDELSEIIGGHFLGDVMSGSPEFEDWKDDFNSAFYRDLEVRIAATSHAASDATIGSLHAGLIRLITANPSSLALRETEAAVSQRLGSIPRDFTTPSTQQEPTSVPFIGRKLELALLTRMLDKAGQGEGGVVLVEGNPGLGKTRLVAEFAERTKATLLHARCYEPEKHIPLNATVDLLQPLAASASVTALPAVYRAAIADVLPIGISKEPGATLPKLSPAGAQRRLFEAMLSLLTMESVSHTLLIIVDDVQWADESTLAFLHFVGRRLDDKRILLVLCSRPTRRTASLKMVAGKNSCLNLSELCASDLESHNNSWFAKDIDAQRAMLATGGNPFLLAEYIKTHAESGSAGEKSRLLMSRQVGEFVHNIVSDLPINSRRVAATMSAIGRPIRRDTLRAIIGTTNAALDSAIKHLLRARIAVVGRRGISFRHDIIRERVYTLLPKGYRRRLHCRIARVLKQENASADAVALQAFKAGLRRTAFKFALEAARAAEHKSSTDELRYYAQLAIRTAVSKRIRTRLRYQLATKLYRAGRFAEALQVGRAAGRDPKSLSSEEQAELFLREVEILSLLGRIHITDVEQQLAKFRSECATSLNNELKYEELRILTRAHTLEGHSAETIACTNEIAALARTLPVARRSIALSFTGRAEAIAGSYKRGLIFTAEAEQYLKWANAEDAAATIGHMAAVSYVAGDYTRPLQLYDEALSLIKSSGAMHLWARTATDKIAVLVDTGNFYEARIIASEFLEKWGDDYTDHYRATTHANCAIMHYHLGELAEAEARAQLAVHFAQKCGPALYTATLPLLGLIQLDQGNISEAKRHYLELRERSQNRFGDRSQADIFAARWLIRINPDQAIDQLRQAVYRCEEQSFGGWLQLRLELARHLRRRQPAEARAIAEATKATAREVGYVLAYENAAALLAKM